MKKVISFILALSLALSLCACGASLTAEQKKCLEEADELFNHMASRLGMDFNQKTESKSGKLLYVATLNFDGDLDDSNAKTFQQSVVPAAEKILGKADIYIILYLQEHGKDEYRLIDSKLDPNLLE